MKALVLCAGLGTRLGQVSKGVPKPLIPIGGEPCLNHILSKIELLGVNQVIINTHLKHEEFQENLSRYRTNMDITLDYEPDLLGTAGTLKKHISGLSTDNFWVLHGDNFFKDDLFALRDKVDKAPENIKGGLGVFRTLNHKKVGIVKKTRKGIIKKIHEKNLTKHGFLANSAVYYFRPSISRELQELTYFQRDISVDLLPKLTDKIIAVALKGYFIDIGTPTDLMRAQRIAQRIRGY